MGIIISKNQEKIHQIKHRGSTIGTIPIHGYHFCSVDIPISTDNTGRLDQPINLPDGSTLLFDGRIFNYPDKYNDDLSYLIDLFSNTSILGVLNEANKWDGSWAIVHLSPDGDLTCFTDPLGKRQLYYNTEGEICSEIRPIAELKYLDTLYKSKVYKWGYNTDDLTPWANVKRIQPNKVYTFRDGKLTDIGPQSYFDWTMNKPEQDLKTLITDAVRTRLKGINIPIGMMVSGGLDSAILARVTEDLGVKVNYFSIENHESQYARLLEADLGIKIKYLDVNYSDQDIADAFTWNETPVDLGSVLPQHAMMGVIPYRVVISGDGADELFGGYRRINQYDSQRSDIFEELSYYHLPRLDRAAMRRTISLRNPFLSHDVVKFALGLTYESGDRINKKILKDTFRGMIPDEIIDRPKLPLKNDMLVADPIEYRNKVFNLFYNKLFTR